jgi:hypothetical protein
MSINQFLRQTDRFQAWLDEQGIPTTLSVESWQLEEYISGGLLQQPVAADARAGARLRGPPAAEGAGHQGYRVSSSQKLGV